VDVFELGTGSPILHDLNPGIAPSGLFWTVETPGAGIHVTLGNGSASMEADDVPILDDIYGAPPPTPGFVSFRVVWSGVNERLHIRNDDPIYGGFAGAFIRNTAQMEWSATVGDFTFVSAPLATSSSSFAEIGHERNGIFYRS